MSKPQPKRPPGKTTSKTTAGKDAAKDATTSSAEARTAAGSSTASSVRGRKANAAGDGSAKQSRREELRLQRERELQAARRRRQMRLGAWIVGIVVLLGALVWAFYTFKDRIGATNSVPPHANGDRSGILANPGKARSGAPLLVLYEDFQCPGCKQYHTAFADKVNAAAEAGKIQLELRTMSFLDGNLGNDASKRAAVAAACADNAGVYVAYHDAVFDNQPKQEGVGYTDTLLRDTLPVQVGLSGEKLVGFQRCYDQRATLMFVSGVDAAAGRAGVNGTPTYMLNGKDITQQLNPADPSSIDKFLTGS